MAENEVKVGIADLNLVLAPGCIMTIGLGQVLRKLERQNRLLHRQMVVATGREDIGYLQIR